MSWIFDARADELERMDQEVLDAATTSAVLGDLERINRTLGGWRATLSHLKRFSRHWAPGQTIRILDWGTGGADLPRAIVRWARQRGRPIQITGIDNSAPTLAYARKACRDYPEIRLMEGDIHHLPALHEPFDYAISSLCLHHLPDAAIVELLKASDRFTSRGLIFNDLKRSARAWLWIKMLSRFLHMHPIVQHDGPLSVKRAFVKKDLATLAQQAGLTYVDVYTHFGYRLVLAGEKL